MTDLLEDPDGAPYPEEVQRLHSRLMEYPEEVQRLHSRLVEYDDLRGDLVDALEATREAAALTVHEGEVLVRVEDVVIAMSDRDTDVTDLGVSLNPLQRRLIVTRLRYWADRLERHDAPDTRGAS